MNSYPPELLVQLAPVMFVAGLDAPPPQSPSPADTTKYQDPFALLTARLRDALLSQRKVSIWQPDKTKSFQVLLVDKDIRFPPRKIGPPDDSQHAVAHSPLSPLTPSSPLYPDGLIAPIWIRKHTTLVPSVFVLFLRLFEFPLHNLRSPLDAPDHDREKDREQEERKRDGELAAYVASRKKSTNERNMKLTVVLMASRRMLDDPALDARLTFIRKQSGLDARAALFVLSPVSSSELGEFVQSKHCTNRQWNITPHILSASGVKRNRHTQAVSSYSNPLSPVGHAGTIRPLRPEGWTVRYEYKMACFAEFRGEDEVALKHYQDAYEVLAVMFGSISILPPRTKRWAEAKVLADCINIKITKLYLYNNEHSLALSHHNTHIRKFGDLSRGWGIGEETFEYWSWVARQYRILAELLEQGSHTTLSLPSHRPAAYNTTLYSSTVQNPSSSRGSTPALETDALRSLGLNPSHALQHPGFYYYMAARCTEMRRERFLITLDTKGISNSPGFANEKKVDHLVIILELYTKSYELFKKYTHSSQGQSQARLTLWIAYRIGQTYFDSGVEEMDEPGTLQEDLLAVLKSTVPSSPDEPLISRPFGYTADMFLIPMSFSGLPEVKVGQRAAFQISITAPSDVAISELPFVSLSIRFSDDTLPLVLLRHSDEEVDESSKVTHVQLGHISKTSADVPPTLKTNLRMETGFYPNIVWNILIGGPNDVQGQIEELLLTLMEGSWNIQIPMYPCSYRHMSLPTSKWLASLKPLKFIDVKRENSSSVIVRHRPHNVLLSFTHHAPACIDEVYPIVIKVTNADNRELEVTMDVLLQPTEVDDAFNSITLDDERSSGLIKGISFGVLVPGVSSIKTLNLSNTGGAGDRMIDISIQSRVTPSRHDSSEDLSKSEMEDVSEILQTLTVPTVKALNVAYDVVYKRPLAERLGLVDLRRFEEDFWDEGEAGEALVSLRLECAGPWSLELGKVGLERQNNDAAKVLEASTDVFDEADFSTEYVPGDEFSGSCRISLQGGEQQAIPGPGTYLVEWRRIYDDGTRGSTSKSIFPLPLLRPPTDGLIGLLQIPPVARLHEGLPLTLTIRNNHPTRSASCTVHVEPDPSDGFVVAGLRSGRVPILLPGAEEKILWNVIPVECGYIKLPKIKVIDHRKSVPNAQGVGEGEVEGQAVKIVDVRLDRRKESVVTESNEVEKEVIRPTDLETDSEEVWGIQCWCYRSLFIRQ
ncbi:Gryzun, putative trafficking through golgi-domain-containing protein [Desarmillaria tabescens]|uniref:Trafficking protein particle complex subunit 11 n=1 Tax=Armillaria tabescens TaxID=1929756 RepID=A0AA39N5Q7_ARMTA|nr:Gryzun, putative trafficking through golgi-domain-containing protein [Desarmillaria tabescens]KAK0459106.1 Gryzun, putative trafficking through golgi-domain-containing protein [Desarmillaria tabescens]